MPKRNNEFYKHNFNSFFIRLKPFFKLEKFPYSDRNILIQKLKWILNPSLIFRDLLEMKFPFYFKTSIKPKIRYNKKDKFYKLKSYLNEIRWRILEG